MMARNKYGKLLTVENAKTVKGEKLGYLTGILYMTPERQGPDGANLCAYSTPGCRASCLNTAGRGAFNSVQVGRARKRALFMTDPSEAVAKETYARYVLDTQGYWAYYLLLAGAQAPEVKP